MLEYFINNSKVTLLLMVTVIVIGVISLLSIKREAFPNVDFAKASVKTYYPGATPEDIEILITKKIEDALRGNSAIKQITSISQEGLSDIKIALDLDNIDVEREMNELQRAIDRITDFPTDLPNKPVFNEIKTANLPVLEISVTGNIEYETLRNIVDDLEQSIENLVGVASVAKIGYLEQEFKISISPEKMQKKYIGFNQLLQALQSNNIDIPGGNLLSTPLETAVRTENKLNNISAIENVVVRTNLSDKNVFVKDIATVTKGYVQPKIITKTNGKPSIIMVVSKDKQADIIQLTDAVKDKLLISIKNLPKGVDIIISNDESKRTINRLQIVTNNSFLGFILLFIGIMLFMSLRNSIVTSMSVPIVILFTLSIMSFLNISFNIISMLAIIISLGMFVDNSIIVSENIYRLTQNGMPLKQAAINGIREIAVPIFATVLTTIAAFAPMFVTSGVLGQFIWAIPLIVSLSLLISLFESFCFLPTRIIKLQTNVAAKNSKWFTILQDTFVAKMDLILEYKYLSLFVAVLWLLTAFLYAFFRMDFVLFPAEGVDRFVVKYSAPVGTPIEKVHAAVQRVEDYLMQLPAEELVAVTTRTGIQQEGPGDPLANSGDNVGMMIVYLTSASERVRSAEQIISELREKFPVYPPLERLQFGTIINGPPVGKAVTVNITGDELSTLQTIADQVKRFLLQVSGVRDIEQDLKPGMSQLQVTLQPGMAEKFGVNARDVALSIRNALEGVVVTTVRDFAEDVDVRLLLEKNSRASLEVLSNLLVSNQYGKLIPLNKLVNFKQQEGSQTRRHYNFQRSLTVTAGIDRKQITSSKINGLLSKEFLDIDQQYPGYNLKLGGEEESSQESIASLAKAMILAVFAIFTILVAVLKSYLKPFLIMFSIPFSFIGPIMGFAIHDKPFGFLAMVGIIGLSGVVINTAIIFVAIVDKLHQEQGLGLRASLLEGARLRLRPIMLTTITTIAALMPTAYGFGGYDPVLVPMTLAMSWGLLFGTALTLIVVPCGYLIIEDILNKCYSLRNK